MKHMGIICLCGRARHLSTHPSCLITQKLLKGKRQGADWEGREMGREKSFWNDRVKIKAREVFDWVTVFGLNCSQNMMISVLIQALCGLLVLRRSFTSAACTSQGTACTKSRVLCTTQRGLGFNFIMIAFSVWLILKKRAIKWIETRQRLHVDLKND